MATVLANPPDIELESFVVTDGPSWRGGSCGPVRPGPDATPRGSDQAVVVPRGTGGRGQCGALTDRCPGDAPG